MTVPQLLHLAARGRLHYAECAPPGSIARYRLETEAAVFEQAAMIAEGSLDMMTGVLPTFMWDEIQLEGGGRPLSP